MATPVPPTLQPQPHKQSNHKISFMYNKQNVPTHPSPSPTPLSISILPPPSHYTAPQFTQLLSPCNNNNGSMAAKLMDDK